jgi:hypothetical protein
MSVGQSRLAVATEVVMVLMALATVAATEVLMVAAGDLQLMVQLMVQDGVVDMAQAGVELITAPVMAILMLLRTIHHQSCMSLRLSRWCWLLSLSHQFGITVKPVSSIFHTYKVAHRVGRLSQQHRPQVMRRASVAQIKISISID